MLPHTYHRQSLGVKMVRADQLCAAVDSCRLKELESLISKKTGSINDYNSSGDTALHCASIWPLPLLVRMLLDAGANPNERSRKDGDTPLHTHFLSEFSDVRVVRLLLERGADPNKHNYKGDTPLSLACARGDVSAVQALLDYGADPRDGGRPLRAATEFLHKTRQRSQHELESYYRMTGKTSISVAVLNGGPFTNLRSVYDALTIVHMLTVYSDIGIANGPEREIAPNAARRVTMNHSSSAPYQAQMGNTSTFAKMNW